MKATRFNLSWLTLSLLSVFLSGCGGGSKNVAPKLTHDSTLTHQYSYYSLLKEGSDGYYFLGLYSAIPKPQKPTDAWVELSYMTPAFKTKKEGAMTGCAVKHDVVGANRKVITKKCQTIGMPFRKTTQSTGSAVFNVFKAVGSLGIGATNYLVSVEFDEEAYAKAIESAKSKLSIDSLFRALDRRESAYRNQSYESSVLYQKATNSFKPSLVLKDTIGIYDFTTQRFNNNLQGCRIERPKSLNYQTYLANRALTNSTVTQIEDEAERVKKLSESVSVICPSEYDKGSITVDTSVPYKQTIQKKDLAKLTNFQQKADITDFRVKPFPATETWSHRAGLSVFWNAEKEALEIENGSNAYIDVAEIALYLDTKVIKLRNGSVTLPPQASKTINAGSQIHSLRYEYARNKNRSFSFGISVRYQKAGQSQTLFSRDNYSMIQLAKSYLR